MVKDADGDDVFYKAPEDVASQWTVTEPVVATSASKKIYPKSATVVKAERLAALQAGGVAEAHRAIIDGNLKSQAATKAEHEARVSTAKPNPTVSMGNQKESAPAQAEEVMKDDDDDDVEMTGASSWAHNNRRS